ncbi:glutamate--tRNA ligase family protein [Sulfurospirillum deleyianum]|uniref:Glutamyl/glutaminyl-tRNA synthetase, class Ic, catalytic domain protein n=1 Tax=Sulfurospirillum deleyianum (strain ATCC 51133 / DSM 6946 / 5175) TaxID=525898 RepID=D1B099_SULD5|nr:glutamate--tRNA ligase family protein [Sulfurospirillum deleyianum]ACZ11716.1 Glutamyl/glutaminyl-tRNA synthetase, class Ic, catalytic domain protein [Sulfurospirillum deleyianum DSM 6946]
MVRFSFAPTHDMLASELRIALLSALYAQQKNLPLIVRIEDGKRSEAMEAKEDAFLEILSLFGIFYTQLYYQRHNFKYHLQFASTLLDRKKAFICFCPEEKASPYDGTCEHLNSEEILNNPSPFVIRMKPSPTTNDSFTIMQRDKYPTLVFARACDDMLQGASTLIREEACREDAAKENLVRKALGYEEALNYLYVPNLQNADTIRVKALLDEGFMPEAIAQYLLALGTEWLSNKEKTNTPVAFEKEALRHMNKECIQNLSDMELSKRLGYACENIGKLAKLYTTTLSTTAQIKGAIDAIFAKKEPLQDFETESTTLQTLILEAPYFESYDAFETYLAEKSGLKAEAFVKPLCYLLMGKAQGLTLAQTYPLIKNYLKEIVR